MVFTVIKNLKIITEAKTLVDLLYLRDKFGVKKGGFDFNYTALDNDLKKP